MHAASAADGGAVGSASVRSASRVVVATACTASGDITRGTPAWATTASAADAGTEPAARDRSGEKTNAPATAIAAATPPSAHLVAAVMTTTPAAAAPAVTRSNPN